MTSWQQYGIKVRYAGNPKVSSGLDEETREALSVIYHVAKNDIEVAKEIIRYDKDLSEHADEIIAQLEAFVASEKSKAKTPDGTNCKRITESAL